MNITWSRTSLSGDEVNDNTSTSLSSDDLAKAALVKLGNVHIEVRSDNGVQITARARYSISPSGKKLHGYTLRLSTTSDESFGYFIVDKCRLFISPLKRKLVEVGHGPIMMKQIVLKKNRPCEIDFNESYVTKIKLRNK